MSDETTILRVAEAERDQAAKAYADPRKQCLVALCPVCWSLSRHVIRTGEQVALLTPAETESEALF